LVPPKGKRKRSKIVTIMLLPALVVIFIIGWCMYCVGDQKRPTKRQDKPLKKEKDYVTIMPIVYEETQEIINE
jgi:flagellar basal body-associated protein FliL